MEFLEFSLKFRQELTILLPASAFKQEPIKLKQEIVSFELELVIKELKLVVISFELEFISSQGIINSVMKV